MKISRNNLEHLNNFPFIYIGADSEGTVFFKNRLAEIMFPSIKLASKLDRYSSIRPEASSVQIGVLCGNKYTAIIQKIYDDEGLYYLIAIFEASYKPDGDNKSMDSRLIALKSLITEEVLTEKAKNAFTTFRNVKQFENTLAEWRNFSNLYIEQCRFGNGSSLSLESFLISIERVVNNRLDLGVKINYVPPQNRSSTKMSASLAAIVMNLLSFIILSSTDRCLTVALNENEESSFLKFAFNSRLSSDENEFISFASPKLITLLTGITICEENDINIDFLQNNTYSEIKLSLLRSDTSSFIFSSNENDDKLTEGFFRMLKLFFEA